MHSEDKYKIEDALSAFKHWSGDRTGKLSDDFPFSDLAIIQKLIEARAQVLSQEIRMGRPLSREVEQTLPCVEMIEVNRKTTPGAPPADCKWFRSRHPIPSDLLIMSVTGMVAGKDNPRFNFVGWEKYQYIETSRVSSSRNSKYYTLRDTGEGYFLYLYNEDFLEKIAITGVWSDPIEAARYPRCGKQDPQALCYPKRVPFHIDRRLTNLIFETAITVGVPKRQFAGADIRNNDQPS